jgi:hypothetical protein
VLIRTTSVQKSEVLSPVRLRYGLPEDRNEIVRGHDVGCMPVYGVTQCALLLVPL